MFYRILGDGVVGVPLGFLAFVGTGALLAWRWPSLVWAHLPALAWSAGPVTIGFLCPLTVLEKRLRVLAGGEAYRGTTRTIEASSSRLLTTRRRRSWRCSTGLRRHRARCPTRRA
ncbi:MAG: DUF2784 domain-containing protein [Acidimicrobiales bacterium]